MKRHLLTLAIAATLLPLAAQAAPRVYGQLDLSVDYMDADVMGPTSDVWELNSNSSRVGVKGAEKLTEEYTAVYKMEWEVNGDVGGADLKARERYIGIKHYQWGTMRLGYIDAPFKNAEDDVDMFNDLTHLDMGNFIYGQNRLANSINYVSPKFLDVFGANITLQPGEQAGSGGCGPVTTTFELDSKTGAIVPNTMTGNACENHLADGYSTAFSYEDDSLYLSFAMDKEITNMDAMRFNARYKMGDMMLSGMYQMAEPTKGANAQEDSFVVSGSYKMDMMTFRGEVLVSNKETGLNTDMDTTLIGVGVDYNITENTKVFGNLANKKVDTGATDSNTTYLGVGTEVRF